MTIDTRHRCLCGHPRDEHVIGTPHSCRAGGCGCQGYLRGSLPTCDQCNHPGSLHAPRRSPHGQCRAAGCTCPRWQQGDPPAAPPEHPNISNPARPIEPTEVYTAPTQQGHPIVVSTKTGRIEIPLALGQGDVLRVSLSQRSIGILLSRPTSGQGRSQHLRPPA